MKKILSTFAVTALLLAAPAFLSPVFAAEKAETTKKEPAKTDKGKKKFAVCDKDGDGALLLEEASVCYPKLKNKMAVIDANKDGKITEEELRAYRKNTRKKFDDCDKDKDGALTLEEAKVCFPQIEKKFGLIDTDKDGKITREELRAAAKKQKEARKKAS